ncbi:lipoprotein [Streptomyces viridochromogenes DSM 40736]|uniref:Lipoprotein n=1 Tax=Streptomyces viridochromogenes (strain DSM 40736 / JCM 4977 / BCRC 1201 / Tue 494) TaxID=591159 RepID=D9X887_STRVT|nr:lipoprotein [Streptomyces viridochromogenes DSM 40736]
MLTACGGGGDEKSQDDIKGAGGGPKSPAASASGPAAADRPDVSVPKDLKLVFDFDKPSDVKQAAALADAENYIRALKHGIAEQDPEDPAYRFYSGAQASQYAKSQIESWVKGGWTVTGTDKYYDEDVTPLKNGKSIVVSFCRNQAEFYGREIKSKKVLHTKESLDSYQSWKLLMIPPSGPSQVWKTGNVEVFGKAKQCR